MQGSRQSSTKVVFVGSFDPFHEGHRNIVERALNIFGKVIIGVGVNPEKNYLLTPDERVKRIKQLYKNDPRVEVEAYSGLTIDFARNHNAAVIVKGVRNSEDFEYEKQQAEWNKTYGGIDTVLLVADAMYENISSTSVREKMENKDNKQ